MDELQIGPLNTLKKGKEIKKRTEKASRKRKGSMNRKKRVVRVKKIYQQIRDARTDFNHNVL
ncbi:MAG: hypothetical protein QXY52_06795 [Conexivisphaerales archaeon]